MILSYFKNLIQKKRPDTAEEARIEKAIADFKQNPQDWDDEKFGLRDELRSEILNRLMASIRVEEEQYQDHQPFYRRKIWMAAASVVLVAGICWLGLQHYGQTENVANAAIPVIVKTGNDDIRKLVLSDSSVVWLNSNSELRYPDRFGDKREVTLTEGEAYFDIRHDEHKPFQVRAGKTLTNVLGTAFNISAYSKQESIDVTVTRGKVAVNDNILMPNEQLTYRKHTGQSEKKSITADEATLWMRGQLAFDNLSFKSVAVMLENKYQVSIRFDRKEIENMRLTGKFGPPDNLHDILEALTLTVGLTYETKGDVITIK